MFLGEVELPSDANANSATVAELRDTARKDIEDSGQNASNTEGADPAREPEKTDAVLPERTKFLIAKALPQTP